jgi:GntR family transcriptional regulator
MTAADRSNLFLVDASSDLPIWVQLRNRFALLIKTGHFKEGEQLPSVRSLAATARINYNTVTRAYRDLELEGLVTSVRGRGMYVNRLPEELGDTSTAYADALFEDCVRQYRALGMTHDDILDHVSEIIEENRKTTEDEIRKRMELCQ